MPTRTFRPSGAARVQITSMVCGWQSPATMIGVACALHAALGQRHRLGRRSRLVEHRRVGDRHAGEVADHRLEVDQRLQPPLRDLGLVRRVGGVPGRVLEDVAQDDAGRERAVVALADEALHHLVAGRDAAQLGQRLRSRSPAPAAPWPASARSRAARSRRSARGARPRRSPTACDARRRRAARCGGPGIRSRSRARRAAGWQTSTWQRVLGEGQGSETHQRVFSSAS